MHLIKHLPVKYTQAGNTNAQGLFLCPYCNKEVERNLTSGRQSFSCGCAKKIIKRNRILLSTYKKERICLLCEQKFISRGVHNRRCAKCNSEIETKDLYYIPRIGIICKNRKEG